MSCSEPLAIEIKLSLDRWCKPESLPSPAPSPEKTATAFTSASSGQFGNMMGGGVRSANSSRFMFSSFLGFGSTGEASASTFNMHDPHSASAGSHSGHDAGMIPLPPSVTSMSSGNGSSATTLPGLSGKHRPLPKIVEESHEFSRSESSSAQDSHQQRHLRPTTGSHSNEALDALFDFGVDNNANTATNTPTNPNASNNHNNNYRNSKSTGSIMDRVRGAHHTPSHISSSTSSGASSSRRSGKSLRAKERTWVYHAVMSVVQDMQAEHEVPIVVFL